MSENLAYDYALQLQRTLEELWEAIDNDEGYDGHDDAREYLEELPLEVVYELGEPFAVVLTVGGPHAEITGGGRSSGYELTVYWGGDKTVLRGEAITRTGEYFRDYAEELS